MSFSKDYKNENEQLNSDITILGIFNALNIDLDSNILNRYVFAKIKYIIFYGQLSSIEIDLFKPFEYFRSVRFDSSIKRVIHKQGITWISYINSNLSVNLTNATEVNINFEHYKQITIGLWNYYYSEKTIKELFPDEDFCLYKNFPFDQLVVLIQLNVTRDGKIDSILDTSLTCTYLWLAQYFPTYLKFPLQLSNNSEDTFTAMIRISELANNIECNFSKMLNTCGNKRFQTYEHVSKTSMKDITIGFMFSSYLFFILSMVVSFIGIVSNLSMIIAISHKKNKQERKELKHFHYIRLNASFNLIRVWNRILSNRFGFDF